ncbi:unnamed protein product [Choristocarpus tenellus]
MKLNRRDEVLGEYDGKEVHLRSGRYGLYIAHDGVFANLPKKLKENEEDITVKVAMELIQAKRMKSGSASSRLKGSVRKKQARKVSSSAADEGTSATTEAESAETTSETAKTVGKVKATKSTRKASITGKARVTTKAKAATKEKVTPSKAQAAIKAKTASFLFCFFLLLSLSLLSRRSESSFSRMYLYLCVELELTAVLSRGAWRISVCAFTYFSVCIYVFQCVRLHISMLLFSILR